MHGSIMTLEQSTNRWDGYRRKVCADLRLQGNDLWQTDRALAKLCEKASSELFRADIEIMGLRAQVRSLTRDRSPEAILARLQADIDELEHAAEDVLHG